MPFPKIEDLVTQAAPSDPVANLEKTIGTYHDSVHDMPDDESWPTGQLPQGPEPDPFKLGPLTSGGR